MDNRKYNLFLDDVRQPSSAWMNYFRQVSYDLYEWVVVRNYSEFCQTIDTLGIPDFVSYDHDLAESHYDHSMFESIEAYEKQISGSQEKTGLECAQYLLEKLSMKEKEHPRYVVHSQNPVGRQRIQNCIEYFNNINFGRNNENK